jgi:hypothetical protein
MKNMAAQCRRERPARAEGESKHATHNRRTSVDARAYINRETSGRYLRAGLASPMLGASSCDPAMYRLTARLMLVFLLAGVFVPVGMAISVPLPHACCMRKAMHDHGSGVSEVQAVGGRDHNCCPPFATAHWAELGPGIDSGTDSLLAYLAPDSHPTLRSNLIHALRPVRGPPLS